MKVLIPTPLHAYTRGRDAVEACGSSLTELLDDLDLRHPGLRFRIVDEQERVRPHVRFFVNGEMVRSLDHTLGDGDAVQIVCALSGG